MADERKYDRESVALSALGPQIKPAPKHFWKIFPDYSLTEDFSANAKVSATLKECYEPTAISLRVLFLMQAKSETEALANNYDEIWPVSIAQDLFNSVGRKVSDRSPRHRRAYAKMTLAYIRGWFRRCDYSVS